MKGLVDPELNLRRVKKNNSRYQYRLKLDMIAHGARVTRSAARKGDKVWMMMDQEPFGKPEKKKKEKKQEEEFIELDAGLGDWAYDY